MQRKWIRGALVGGLAFLLANVVSNMLSFQLGAPLLFDNPAQSKKLLAVLFELHAPFNMFGETLQLVSLELLFWVAVVGVEGLVLAWGYGRPSES